MIRYCLLGDMCTDLDTSRSKSGKHVYNYPGPDCTASAIALRHNQRIVLNINNI